MSTTEPAPIRLLIVDDHPVVRDGLRGMFAGDPLFDVIGEAADGEEAIALAQTRRPDVVLMDLRMPGVDGATAIRRLGELGNSARVLVLTTYDSDSDVVPALEAGAGLPAQGHAARGTAPGHSGRPSGRVGAGAVRDDATRGPVTESGSGA